MDVEDFRMSVNKICEYFQAKPIPSSLLRLWVTQVRYIPTGQPLQSIEQEIMDKDSMPRNLPKAYKDGWELWKSANQEMLIAKRIKNKTQCLYCGGTGFLHTRKQSMEVVYDYVNRCHQCRNWEDQVHEASCPAYTKDQLLGKGFKLLW